MARYTRHISVNVSGAIRNKSFDIWEDDNGKPIPKKKAEAFLKEHRLLGHRVVPMNGEPCEGWSYETGCPGHKHKDLHLVLKHKWFDMIASGEKKEEYREIKPFWIKRLLPLMGEKYITVIFHRGYSKDRQTLAIRAQGIYIGHPHPRWSGNWPGMAFIIRLKTETE